MKLFYGLQQLKELKSNLAVTIGNFDGVHRGHQALLEKLRANADAMSLPTLVMLFEPQSAEYFKKEEAPARLSTLREKLHQLAKLKVDYVCCLKFDHLLASMPAHEFAENVIFSKLGSKYLLVGKDFRFGKKREGDFTLLELLGRQHDCVVEHLSDFTLGDQRVSSTQIREALKLGQLDIASNFLGRPYSMCGRVVRGDGRARLLGFPTANIKMSRQNIPLKGVYCVRVNRLGTQTLMGVANIGCRPTLDGSQYVLEVHLFDCEESLYGELLHVSFLHKIRDEMKFASIDALIAAIHKDVLFAKHFMVSSSEK